MNDPSVWGSVAIAGAVIAYTARAVGRKLHNRVKAKTSAYTKFEIHMIALERFCADEAVPDRFKRDLLMLSEAFDDKSFVCYYAKQLLDGKVSERREQARLNRGVISLDDLSAQATENLGIAIKNGLLAAFLRWPETSNEIDQLLIEFSGKTERREIKSTLDAREDFSKLRGNWDQMAHA